jgi:hypothetical protein
MIRKSPDKQWNRQNSILFHKTIPLMFGLFKIAPPNYTTTQTHIYLHSNIVYCNWENDVYIYLKTYVGIFIDMISWFERLLTYL